MTNEMEKGSLNGKTGKHIKEDGRKGSRMGWEFLYSLMERVDEENGKMVNV